MARKSTIRSAELSDDDLFCLTQNGDMEAFNTLFKRAILESKCPTVYFLDQQKFPYQFKPDRCYSVCNKQFPFRKVCEEVPLAIACAWRTGRAALDSIKHLEAMGFRQCVGDAVEGAISPVILMNDAFREIDEKWRRRATAP